MLIRLPSRNAESVTLLPLVLLAVDNRVAGALHDVVDGRGSLLDLGGRLSGPQTFSRATEDFAH